MNNTFYITTPIYYPSGSLHIGHAYTTSIVDIIARYKKQQGYETFMLTGSDDHGQKIEEKAKEAGVAPLAFVDNIVENNFKPLFARLNIENDIFMRTTNSWHEETVQKVFMKLKDLGYIYKGEYTGLYCVKCEAFYTESQLEEGNICPDHGTACEEIKQESYMFAMSKFQEWIKTELETNGDKFASPEVVKELLNNFIIPGLTDLSITRTNFTWGIPIPGDEKHVIYVWLDALFNYLTAIGYRAGDNEENFDKFWNGETVHVIGRDITRFHSIYWPIFLKALDIKMPTRIVTHGLITDGQGRKMGKSLGNTIDPNELIDAYGSDAVRFYLAKEIPMNSNGKISIELFEESFNSNLANKYGNLVSRTIGMVSKYYDGKLPAYNGEATDHCTNLTKVTKEKLEEYISLMDQFKIDKAMDVAIDLVVAANEYIDLTMPWALAKDETKNNELASVMIHLVKAIEVSTWMLKPVIVENALIVEEQIGTSIVKENILDFVKNNGITLNKTKNLFERLAK